MAKAGGETELTSGMALLTAAPVRGSNRTILGALYGGVLLNRNFAIVDRVWELVLKANATKAMTSEQLPFSRMMFVSRPTS